MSDDKPVLKIARKGVAYDRFYLHGVDNEPRKRRLEVFTEQALPVAQTVKVWVEMGSIRLSGRVMLFRDEVDEKRYSGVAEF